MAGNKGDRTVRSLRDVEKIVEMHGLAKENYEVRVAAVHSIKHSGTMQHLLRTSGWIVDGMQHLDGVVAVHRLISRSARLLDSVIREVVLIQERGLAQGHRRQPLLSSVIRGVHSDDDDDYELMSSLPRLPSAFQEGERALGEGHRVDSCDDFRYEPARRPRVPSGIRRSRSDGSLSSTSRLHGSMGAPAPRLPLPRTDRRHDEAPRFVGPISPPPAALPAYENCPLLDPDVEQEGEFLGQVLLLEYPDPRPIGPHAVSTVSLSKLMLEAGTGTGEQPLLRAPDLVGLAAMAVAGQSPPRHLNQHPALRTLVTELIESAQAMRRHEMGSNEVRSLVVELGGRLELVATDIFTERRPLPDLLPLLQLVKTNLHSLWEMRVPAQEFKLM